MPLDAASRQCPGAFLNSGFFVRVLFFAVAVAGCTVAAAALALPAALLGYPNYGQCEQDRQHQQGDDTAYSNHKKTSLSKEFQPQYTPFDAEEQSKSTVAPNFLQKSKIRACIWAYAVI